MGIELESGYMLDGDYLVILMICDLKGKKNLLIKGVCGEWIGKFLFMRECLLILL